jgi:diguanylate cyclase (GGDEF)-like protein
MMLKELTEDPEPRLAAIEQLRVLDRIADPALQGMARLAAHVAGSSSAAIHIIGAESEHRIAGYAAPLGDTPVADSMCRLVVESRQAIVTRDATADERFAYSPLISGEAPIRFYAAFPMRTGDGEVVGTVCAFDTREGDLPEQSAGLLEDIALQASTHLGLMRLVGELGTDSTRDGLTGAANRLVLEDRLAHHLARIARHGTQLVVASIDVGGFAAVRDSLGQSAGDRLLQEVARRLASSVRAEDLVARIGDDEFAVVAERPEQGLELESFRERLDKALGSPFTIRGKLVEADARVGAVLARRDESAAEIMARADAEMKLHQ